MNKSLKKTICLVLAALLTVFAVSAVSEGENDAQAWLALAEEAHRDEDYETALRYYVLAAQAGDMGAQIMAAVYYYSGMGTEQSY